MRRIAMISVHTCPLAALGGKETGGMNVYVRELSRELGRRDLSVDIFTRSQDASVPRVRELWRNVRVIHLPAGPEKPYPKNLVYSHLPEFVDGLKAFTASQGVIYDLIHSHYWLSGWVARELSRDRPVPTVHMFHTLGQMKNAVARSDAEKEMPERIQVEHALLRDLDRIVAASPLDQQQMVELYQADPAKIRIIPLGVDTRLFRPIPHDEALAAISVDLPKDQRVILFVGRMDPLKGLDTLLQAMCKLSTLDPALARKLCLAVIGGDADETEASLDDPLECLDKLKREVGVPELVVFLGSRAQTTLPYYYSAAEVCIVPSLYESFGLVALEAMACGTPVIASRVGGLQLTVEDGVTGFLVPAGDEDALTDKLRMLLLDDGLRQRLGQDALLRSQSYTWESVADRMLRLYEQLWRDHAHATPQREPSSKR